MFLIQAGSSNYIGVWAIINCGVFLALGIFFIIVGFMYPQVRLKEIDQAKVRANIAHAAAGTGEQTDMLIDNSDAP